MNAELILPDERPEKSGRSLASVPADAGALVAIIARAASLLRYDPQSGNFFWRVTRGRTAVVGSVAGGRLPDGRVHIKIDGHYQYAHRLAFVFMLGRFPFDCVDHIDGDPSNNCWNNLRECSHAQNMQNKHVYKSNSTELIGVSRATRSKKWRATIKINGKCHHLGCFDTPREAHKQYLLAKSRLHKFNPTSRSSAI